MGIIIPNATAALIKTYQKSLFHNPEEPESERIYVFYLLIRPLLIWIEGLMSKYDLEKAEIESELYLYAARLFKYFDSTKSSIIPYLEKYIPWMTSHLVAKLKRYNPQEELNNQIEENYYNIQEQYYWNPNKILFEDRYVGKVFTRGEKYVIYTILTTDKLDLTITGLAKRCGVSRITMINKLKELQELEETKP